MKTILYQLDGSVPNIALMRIASYYKNKGKIELRWGGSPAPRLCDRGNEKVYASLIFEKTKPKAEFLLKNWPKAVIGGTGWDLGISLESLGIVTTKQDYSIYPDFLKSIGFTQRGCRLKCPFCVVPKKEGPIKFEQTIFDIWRGPRYPKEIILLDNDFFGQANWEKRISEIKEGRFKVSFNQGINARFLNDETAAAIAEVDYRDDGMKTKRIYTAWDNSKDEKRLFEGLQLLVKYGVKPYQIMVYILCGYWPWSDLKDWEHRRKQLRGFGAVPYPMPYQRTKESIGFQRWVIGAYDKAISWNEWKNAGYRPEKLIRHKKRGFGIG